MKVPKLNTVFSVQPHQSWVQEYNHILSPAGLAISDKSLDAAGLRGHLSTLMAHIQIHVAVNQYPQVTFCWAAFQPLFAQPVTLFGVVEVQDPEVGLVGLHTIRLSPTVHPIQITLRSPLPFSIHLHLTWRQLQTYWGCTQSLHPDLW